MKKLLFALNILCVLSCTKQNDIQISKINESRINQIMTLDINNQLITYRLLNSAERLELWKRKLSNWCSQEKLNSKQSELIKELIVNLSEDVFEKGTAKNIYFIELYSKHWKERAFKLFGHEITFKMVETIRGKANSNIKMLVRNPQTDLMAKPDCACRSSDCGSMYCDCRASNGACDETTFGCGFLWLQSCTGWCFCGGA